MKQVKTILVITMVIMLTAACGSSKKPTSDKNEFPKQFATNIKMDGDPAEWKDIPALYEKETKCFYTVANDGQAVYLLLKIIDQAQQMKVVRSGMDICFDLKGKKAKQVAIKYPLPSEMGMSSTRDSRDGERKDMKEIMKGLLFLKNEMELEGFKDGMNGRQPLLASTSGIRIATSITADGTLIYELVVPFTAFSTSLSFQTPLSVGIVMKAMEQNAGGGGNMSAVGRPPVGGRPGGGPPGGGMRGSGPGGGGRPDISEMQNLFKENSFWYKFSLASK